MSALGRTCKRSNRFSDLTNELRAPLKTVLDTEFEETYVCGTGYGCDGDPGDCDPGEYGDEDLLWFHPQYPGA